MQTTTLFQKVLKDHGYKATRPRLLVFETFHKHSPLTMAELIGRLNGKVDRVTVYRTTDLFEQLGVIKRIVIGWKYKLELGDIFSGHHHHIICLGCSKIIAVPENAEIERLIEKLGSDNGFHTVAHHLELQGYCQTCRAMHSLKS